MYTARNTWYNISSLKPWRSFVKTRETRSLWRSETPAFVGHPPCPSRFLRLTALLNRTHARRSTSRFPRILSGNRARLGRKSPRWLQTRCLNDSRTGRDPEVSFTYAWTCRHFHLSPVSSIGTGTRFFRRSVRLLFMPRFAPDNRKIDGARSRFHRTANVRPARRLESAAGCTAKLAKRDVQLVGRFPPAWRRTVGQNRLM